MLAVVFDNNTLQLYNTETGQPIYNTKTGKPAWTNSIHDVYEECYYSFSPDGKCLIVEFVDETLQLYDTETGEPAWEKPIANVKDYKFYKNLDIGTELIIATYDKNKNKIEIQTCPLDPLA